MIPAAMKYLLIILSFLMYVLPLQAVTARSYDDAMRKAGKGKPIVLFCYGANYDKVSEKAYESFIRKRGIHVATKSAVLLEVPIYQMPNEKEQKEYRKVMGNHSLPGGIWSYPCLVVMDGSGALRGIVQSAEEMKDPETASAALKKVLGAFDEQEKLIDKAVRAKNEKRASLLAQAADVQAIMPSLSGATPFDPITVVEALQTMPHEEANNYVRQMISSGYYSRRQRQEIMAAYAGHLRRNGASANRLRAVYTEMRNIDPDSIYGAYAEGAIALWVVPKEQDPSKDTPYKTLAQREAEEKAKNSKDKTSTPTGTPDDEGWTPMGSSKKK